jgi:hypothetical protein
MLGGSAAHSIDDFVMTPCTSYFDFDPELACMMAAGFEPFTALPLTRYDLIKDIRAMADVRSEEVRPAVGEDDLAAVDRPRRPARRSPPAVAHGPSAPIEGLSMADASLS